MNVTHIMTYKHDVGDTLLLQSQILKEHIKNDHIVCE